MLRRTRRDPQLGLSLVELMIAVALGLMVLGVVISVFWNTLQSNKKALRMARLVQELRAVTDVMARDLRRAGYWKLSSFATRPKADIRVGGGTADIVSTGTGFGDWGLGQNDVAPVGLSIVGENGRADITAYSGGGQAAVTVVTPFAVDPLPAGSWTLHSFASDGFSVIDVTPDCVLFRADRNGDLTVDEDERSGFRLKSGALQRYVSGTHSCSQGVWTSLTDPRVVTIVAIAFSATGSRMVDTEGDSRVQIREIGISVAAVLTADPFVTRTLQTTVHPPADLYIPDVTP